MLLSDKRRKKQTYYIHIYFILHRLYTYAFYLQNY